MSAFVYNIVGIITRQTNRETITAPTNMAQKKSLSARFLIKGACLLLGKCSTQLGKYLKLFKRC